MRGTTLKILTRRIEDGAATPDAYNAACFAPVGMYRMASL
jgi:hypothetical protein